MKKVISVVAALLFCLPFHIGIGHAAAATQTATAERKQCCHGCKSKYCNRQNCGSTCKQGPDAKAAGRTLVQQRMHLYSPKQPHHPHPETVHRLTITSTQQGSVFIHPHKVKQHRKVQLPNAETEHTASASQDAELAHITVE